MKDDFKYALGSKARDKITGFKGIIICRSQWLHNCNTYGLQPQELHDGKPMERQFFDEPAIEIIEEKVMPEKRDTGGPERPIGQTNR